MSKYVIIENKKKGCKVVLEKTLNKTRMENTIEQAKQFAKEVSPNNQFGIRNDLEKHSLDKHVYEWMRRYANSQISHHLDKLTEEIKENVIEIQHSIDAKTGRKAITKITAEYKLKNKL